MVAMAGLVITDTGKMAIAATHAPAGSEPGTGVSRASPCRMAAASRIAVTEQPRRRSGLSRMITPAECKRRAAECAAMAAQAPNTRLHSILTEGAALDGGG